MSDERLVLAFKKPPDEWGFTRSKTGKCWWRKVDGREWAIKLGEQLAAIDIHGVIKKSETSSGRAARQRGYAACRG